jgi:hypothetical protein
MLQLLRRSPTSDRYVEPTRSDTIYSAIIRCWQKKVGPASCISLARAASNWGHLAVTTASALELNRNIFLFAMTLNTVPNLDSIKILYIKQSVFRARLMLEILPTSYAKSELFTSSMLVWCVK